ncbi:MAG: hypothetical protein P0Y53_11960 [Candidatus Pseudobacter hemicellulosilyticus]|uniref:Uncharacterized protein n=1 Tax=Candidatus Pseudobacter hemicellulosilyticus TaxID=3121375 RepID=A0AAJ6BJE6_9BACT|nr:MAG: hypothetical protein P0Y53_11960 [Pseudobacter sp.]
MKSSSIQEIKQELGSLKPKELVDICLRLAKSKKENKELLHFLLFEAHDEAGFVASVKQEINEAFAEINTDHWYYAKKGLRKILRIISKHSRHIGSKEGAIELLIHFCQELKTSGIPFYRNKVLENIYDQQVKKIRTLIKGVHEDMQFDYLRQVERLEE